MIKEAIIKLVNKGNLIYDEAKQVMLEIMKGETTATQNAAFLAALSTKSTKAETIDEISGCAEAMRSLATPVPHPGMEVMEIVGTGGDGVHSFNIATTSAFVVAAAGVKVAKHGNRAASSLCGTADCLEALGVNINQTPEKALEMLEKTEFLFLVCSEVSCGYAVCRAYSQRAGVPYQYLIFWDRSPIRQNRNISCWGSMMNIW